ncbi:GT-D fold domain-containing glycosyltransferase [Ammoniphilus sp. 3BR4]|uniref:GT-D fold domain-containing protein n=1 Tax=Ammoniphilus sp. 3BR4 TaxID=3158265 RepID=UPI0034666568
MDQTRPLTKNQVLQAIGAALKDKRPFSVVRVGDGENIVLAQYDLLPEKELKKTAVGSQWPSHPAGVRLPDTKARDEVLASLKSVDLIGILPYNDKRIYAPDKYKRPLTDKIFEYHGISPKATFDAYMFRNILSDSSFWKLMVGKRIAVISKWAVQFKVAAQYAAHHWNFSIASTLNINNYYNIPKVLKQLESLDFDIAFLGAGVGAIVLSQQIAERFGKVAIDIGQGISNVAKGTVKIPLPLNKSIASHTNAKAQLAHPGKSSGRHWTGNGASRHQYSGNGGAVHWVQGGKTH